MAKSKPKPSLKATCKARLTRHFQEYEEEARFISVKSVTGTEVVFWYAGHEINFKWEQGYVTRSLGSSVFLTECDWVFLVKYAEELMRAAMNGYKKGGRKKVLKRTKIETAQMSLFQKPF